MRDNTFAIDELLNAWEETYKKGQLTFWIFLALKESNKCVEDIKAFVEKASKQSMSCEEQSLYRTLRKFQNLAIDRKSTRLNSSHIEESRMPSSA